MRLSVLFLIVLFAGCQTTPLSEFNMQPPTRTPPPEASTFTTTYEPYPGKEGRLQWVTQEVERQMKALGYEPTETDPDLTIRTYLESTDPAETLHEDLGSGRIHLQMKAGDRVLRKGSTPELSVQDLNTLSLDAISKIVANFLEAMPER